MQSWSTLFDGSSDMAIAFLSACDAVKKGGTIEIEESDGEEETNRPDHGKQDLSGSQGIRTLLISTLDRMTRRFEVAR